jgi:hypothetical protein
MGRKHYYRHGTEQSRLCANAKTSRFLNAVRFPAEKQREFEGRIRGYCLYDSMIMPEQVRKKAVDTS